MHVFRIGRPRSQAACTCSGRSRWVLRSGRSALHWAVLSHFRRVQHGHFLIYPTTRRPLELICCPLETYRPSGGSPGKRSRSRFLFVCSCVTCIYRNRAGECFVRLCRGRGAHARGAEQEGLNSSSCASVKSCSAAPFTQGQRLRRAFIFEASNWPRRVRNA